MNYFIGSLKEYVSIIISIYFTLLIGSTVIISIKYVCNSVLNI